MGSLAMYFTGEQIAVIGRSFGKAERLAERWFGLGPGGFKDNRYDVQTRYYLADHEIQDRAFAHLCRYAWLKHQGEDGDPEELHFFKICLQDGRILDAVERSASFVKLEPLLCYIATHELVHVVRFNRGDADFDAPLKEKIKEEERVHAITRDILKPGADNDMKLVIDCFRNDYQVGDIFSEKERLLN